MNLAVLILSFVACWRLARLVTADYLTLPIRQWAERRGEKLGYLFECPWCFSIWCAPLTVVPAVLWPDNRVVVVILGCLVASGLSGLLAVIENRLDG